MSLGFVGLARILSATDYLVRYQDIHNGYSD